MASGYKKHGQDHYPAPVLEADVTTVIGDHDNPVTVEMLLDTGADISCLPREVIKELEKRPGSIQRELVMVGDVHGQIFTIVTYRLKIILKGTEPREHTIPVLGVGDVSLLGRDVLNEYHICFDGPGKQWTGI